MKGSFKKSSLLVVSLVMLLSLLSACGGNGANNGANSSSADEGSTTATKTVNGVDISKHVDLKMFLVGDKPADFDAVYDELNKLIEQDFNASLRVEFLPFSDWTQRYPLVFASGDKVDLIFTSDWAMYDQEAAKGAFAEVTDEVLQKYMPMTWEKQEKVSFEQAKINGKAYFIPNNKATANPSQAIVIRGDLREKYGLPEIKSVDDLEAYYSAVAKNEKGIFAYAASQNNDQFKLLMLQQLNELYFINTNTDYVQTSEEAQSAPNKMEWIYETQMYKDWVTRMKSWADQGFWSKNAISNKTQPRDAFENGTSASLIWNIGTIAMSAQTINKTHPEWKPEIYDITEGGVKYLGRYTGDGMAVADSSENKERAFMLLDKMKFDRKYNELLRLGIEGKHWEPVGDDKWKPGPEQDKYAFGSGGTWGFKNEEFERISVDVPQISVDIDDEWEKFVIQNITSGFRLDDSKIRNEQAAINSSKTKYLPLLELGLVDNVDSSLEKYKEDAKKAGQDKVGLEIQSQLDAYLDRVQ
ncbi:ABC transporter substrate-binding protein [Paenibacillus sp. FSL R10-2734]|uniref:ABC transporter substrate-binding protein n=1 Tax=Paenibacillus sp. FSL R10-2734 TaxID=2954691 RepID=UPI0030DA8307